jgi:hypothetical protein
MQRAAIIREVPVNRLSSRRSYPFEHMLPGWSFRVEPDADENLPGLDRLIRAAVRSYQRNFPEGQVPQFEVYVSRQGAFAGIRCTRLPSLGADGPSDRPKFRAHWTTRPLPYNRVKPGECFDVWMPDGCPKSAALMRIRANLRLGFPFSFFRLEIIQLEGRREVVRVHRYI